MVNNAKLVPSRRGRTLSGYMEGSFRSLFPTEIIESLCLELSFGFEYLSREEVEMDRPDLAGKVSSETEIREMRNEGALRIS